MKNATRDLGDRGRAKGALRCAGGERVTSGSGSAASRSSAATSAQPSSSATSRAVFPYQRPSVGRRLRARLAALVLGR